MATVSYRLEDLKKAIVGIGYVGENDHMHVLIDCKEAFDEYPAAVPTMVIVPPVGDSYPKAVTRNGDVVEWLVKNSDVTVEGDGEFQLTFTEDEVIKKSVNGRFRVKRSISGSGEAPSGVQDWVADANEKLAAVEEATQEAEAAAEHQPKINASGYWEIWDAEQGAYVATTVKAQGDKGDPGDPGSPGDPTQLIDDTDTALDKTFSSSKIDTELTNVKTAIQGKPDEKNSDQSGIDLDVSDEDGNVVLRLKDGGIQTKTFNSEDAIQGETQNTDNNADLYFSDENGNGVFAICNGHVRTKKFSSDDDIVEKQFSYTNTAGTATIERFIPAGTSVLLHLTIATSRAGDAIANNTVSYSYTDRAGTSHSIGSEYGYNFLPFTFPEDAVNVKVTYGTGLNWGNNATLSFKIYFKASFDRKPTILTVGASGKDYTSIRQAVEYAKQYADEINRFEIHIYPGTYDILSYFTAEEITASGFYGLHITNGISLIGIGNRNDIILTATMDTTTYNQTKRNDVSTLNIRGNVSIKNLTIRAKNIRYAVHDDYGMMSYQNDDHIYENVKMYGESLTSGGGGDLSFGAGGGGTKRIIMRDCDLSDNMIVHSTTSMVCDYFMSFENCIVRRMNFNDYDSGTKIMRIRLLNCNVAFMKVSPTGTHDPLALVEGTGMEDTMILCPSGYVYKTGAVKVFDNVEVTAGKAVKLTSSLASVEVATSIDNIYGISIGTWDGATYVQTEGWINSNILGLSGLSVGDLLTIDGNGAVTSGGTSANAIAKVKTVDESSVAYAKLMI